MEDILDNQKDYNRNQYKTNTKYQKHTGKRIQDFQRNITGERHWRKMGDIEKKYSNVNRRRNILSDMNESGKSKCIYKLGSPNIYKHDTKPSEMIEKMNQAMKKDELHKSFSYPCYAMDLHNYKYLPEYMTQDSSEDKDLGNNSFRPYFYNSE